MLPIFNAKIILDYNEEGNENVPSEDFEAGFGCVVINENLVLPHLPQVKEKELTDHDKWLIWDMKRTEEQIQYMEDEYLKMHGI